MIRFLTKAVDKFPRSLQELYCRFNLKKGKLKIQKVKQKKFNLNIFLCSYIIDREFNNEISGVTKEEFQEIKIYNWLKRKRKGDGRGNRLAVDC